MKFTFRDRRVFVRRVLAALTALAAGAGCNLQDPKPFDPVALQRLSRERARENVTAPLSLMPSKLDPMFLVPRDANTNNVPASQPTTATSVGPSIRMSLRDLIQLAAANSLQVRVANYQPAIDEARVQEAIARFDPVFTAGMNFQNQFLLTPSPNNPFGGNQNFETATATVGIKQNLPTGAQVQLQYQMQRVFNRSLSATGPADPARFESDLQFQFTQPLLQNAGTAVNEARIVVARNTQRVSLLDARLQLEKTLAEIEEIYWQLVQAEAELVIQEELYQQTVDTSIRLQKRIRVDVTAVSVGQANAALRGRESELVDARIRLKTLSNALKRRVNDPGLPTSGSVVVLADDAPLQTPIRFDLAEQIEAGLSNRAELAQQQIRIDSATVVLNAARNNLLPSLNLVGSIGTKGSGTVFGSAVGEQFADWRFREYAIGFQLEVPIGNREARAIFRRTDLQRLQAIYQYSDLIEQVSQEVRDAHDNVTSNWEKMTRTRQFLYAARNALDQLQIEENSGARPLDENFVNRKLNAQEVLAQARRADAAAIAGYNTAISSLERAKGTILKYDNVIMRQEPLVVGGVGENVVRSRNVE